MRDKLDLSKCRGERKFFYALVTLDITLSIYQSSYILIAPVKRSVWWVQGIMNSFLQTLMHSHPRLIQALAQEGENKNFFHMELRREYKHANDNHLQFHNKDVRMTNYFKQLSYVYNYQHELLNFRLLPVDNKSFFKSLGAKHKAISTLDWF